MRRLPIHCVRFLVLSLQPSVRRTGALRRSFRRLYGTIEILIGLYLIIQARAAIVTELVDLAIIPVMVQIAVALYVLVRGLDNISTSLQSGTKFRTYWDRIFAGD